MNKKNQPNISLDTAHAVILAAGEGKRINADPNKNKVTYEVGGVPMIRRTIGILKDAGIKNMLIVVGFAKESVLKLLDKNTTTVEQNVRLGTGHALKMALGALPKNCKDVLVLNGDDSFLYSPNILKQLFEIHHKTNSSLTFLSIETDSPSGLGRVLRDSENKVLGIIEEKDADLEQKQIKEINPACYLFNVDFLNKYIYEIPKSIVTGEYYLTSLIELAVKHNERIETLKVNNMAWRGVNTSQELREAEKFISDK